MQVTKNMVILIAFLSYDNKPSCTVLNHLLKVNKVFGERCHKNIIIWVAF